MKKQCVLNFLTTILLTLFFGRIAAQNGVHPILNADKSVTFTYYNPDAKNVKVLCDCRLHRPTDFIKRENYHKAKMKRNENGQWVYTTPPLSPEVYTYSFDTDGRRHADPMNPDSVRVRTEKLSVFIIAGTPQTNLYVSDSISGRVDTVIFNNPNGGKERRIIVYLPPQYLEDTTTTFPVLYMLHGLNGNETAWNDRGRATEILDNLIKAHKAEPMIMAMPDANPEILIGQKENVSLAKNIFSWPSWNKMEFEHCFGDMDKFLSTKYRLADARGGRAVAGLSGGGKQAANLANMYDSTFRYVGLFSPVVKRKQLPHDTYSKIWIGGGAGDLFHYQINNFRKKLQRKHIPYTMYNSVGGHTWRNWRVYFTEFVQFVKFNH